MVGQRRKFCFPEPLKRLSHHSMNTFFEKDKHRKEKHKQPMVNSFHKNIATAGGGNFNNP